MKITEEQHREADSFSRYVDGLRRRLGEMFPVIWSYDAEGEHTIEIFHAERTPSGGVWGRSVHKITAKDFNQLPTLQDAVQWAVIESLRGPAPGTVRY